MIRKDTVGTFGSFLDDGFVSPTELEEYNKLSMTRVEGMYDDYLATSFIVGFQFFWNCGFLSTIRKNMPAKSTPHGDGISSAVIVAGGCDTVALALCQAEKSQPLPF